MDLESFVSLKNSLELETLSNEITSLINLLSGGKKVFKNYKGNQILKNPKIQLLKNKIENKVNLVLNKLSELNFNNLLIEFVESFGKITEQDYINIQKAFYLKMQSDISFIKIYVEFFKIISNIYCDFKPDFMIKIIEGKVMYDYNKIILDDEDMQFLKEDDNTPQAETRRINHLSIIRNMINVGFFKSEITATLDAIILEQNTYYSDIYYWYQNRTLDTKTKNIIKNKIQNNTLPLREKVLLDTLINADIQQPVSAKTITKAVKAPEQSAINIDTLHIECDNILEEYIYMESIEEVKIFIETRCKDALAKNKFCQYTFLKYFEGTSDISSKILSFIKLVTKKQLLFKSNLSRGLLLLYGNWEDISIDFHNATKKMKELLDCLKNMGITKNIEHLINCPKYA